MHLGGTKISYVYAYMTRVAIYHYHDDKKYTGIYTPVVHLSLFVGLFVLFNHGLTGYAM